MGSMIWESNTTTTFDEVIIPASFQLKKYPFVQFRLPQYPVEDKLDMNQFENKRNYAFIPVRPPDDKPPSFDDGWSDKSGF